MYKKPKHYDYFEQHRLYRDYRDFVLKDEYIKPVLYKVGVYELDENKKAHLTEMMALTCDNINWAIVYGVLYKKEGTCPVASSPNCIHRMPMSEHEMLKECVTGKKWPCFYKILREKEFNSYSELRAALEYETE